MFKTDTKSNIWLFCCHLSFSQLHFLWPRTSAFHRFSPCYFQRTLHYIFHTPPFTLPSLCFTVPMVIPTKKSDHLATIRMGFLWSRIWGFQLNWKQHWLSRETETVSSSGFTEKVRTKQTKNVLTLILAFSSWQYRHILPSQRICFEEIREENVHPLGCKQ